MRNVNKTNDFPRNLIAMQIPRQTVVTPRFGHGAGTLIQIDVSPRPRRTRQTEMNITPGPQSSNNHFLENFGSQNVLFGIVSIVLVSFHTL